MAVKAISYASTHGRRGFAIAAAFFYFLAMLFLLLVNIGQVANTGVLKDWYFFRFDVSNIVPQSVPDATLVNTIATTIGLHDFYDVGLWNYCEGYYSQGGVTDCGAPTLLFWFDPATVLSSQLLQGAQIDLPSEITGYIEILRIASQVMFGCFFAAVIASFILAVLAPFAVVSKGWTVPLALLGWATALAAVIGAGISTGMWTIFSQKLREYASTINIVPTLGVQMFVFQWIGAGSALLAALIQTCLMCCGTSRRQVRRSYREEYGEEKRGDERSDS